MCLYYIKVLKLVKPTIFCLVGDFHVLYYIKATKFCKLASFGIYEDFLVLY